MSIGGFVVWQVDKTAGFVELTRVEAHQATSDQMRAILAEFKSEASLELFLFYFQVMQFQLLWVAARLPGTGARISWLPLVSANLSGPQISIHIFPSRWSNTVDCF